VPFASDKQQNCENLKKQLRAVNISWSGSDTWRWWLISSDRQTA